MKIIMVILFVSSLASCASCNKNTSPTKINTMDTNQTTSKMKIKIGDKVFTATLYNNVSTAAFKSLLPITVKMIELNGNEKYYDLPSSLPTNASNPGTIQNGDLMLYGSSTLVLFYKEFNTSYNYTRLGKIDDVTGFMETLGSGNVLVTYEKE